MDLRMVSIKGQEDVNAARKMLKEAAELIGFDRISINEMEIAVTELATNLIAHHAEMGEIVFSKVADQLGTGLEIKARDRGPGIPDVAAALQDHSSTKGSMGCGLTAVRRLMDDFDIHSITPERLTKAGEDDHSHEAGTVITVRKWLKPQGVKHHFKHSVYSRPHPAERVNGDSYHIEERRDGLFIAVADGLGHGPPAAEASDKAMGFIRDCGPMEFDRILVELHQMLRKTRGAALTLLRIDLKEKALIHSGVGNVETRLYPRSERTPMPRPGILGSGMLPNPKITRIPWPSGATLIVYTDGVSGRWNLDDSSELWGRHIVSLAQALFQKHARSNDDATLVAAREALQ